MKKQLAILCTTVLVLFSACGAAQASPGGDASFTVDAREQTITSPDGEVYRFHNEGSTLILDYPNGVQAAITQDENGARIDYHGSFDANTMQDAAVLANMLPPPVEDRPLVGTMLALLSVVLGTLTMLFPKRVWTTLVGWQVKELVLSKRLLLVYRLCGALLLLIGIGALLF